MQFITRQCNSSFGGKESLTRSVLLADWQDTNDDDLTISTTPVSHDSREKDIMRTTYKVITAVAVIALSGTLAIAAPQTQGGGNGNGDGWGGGHHRGAMVRHLAKKLNLTDAQKAQTKANRKAFFEANKPFFQQVRATRHELRAARQANDTAKMDALKATAQSQRAQIKQLREQQVAQFVSILTPAQKAQFDQLQAQRAARRAARGK
jgi:periplasmic protein CpxP/Spy